MTTIIANLIHHGMDMGRRHGVNPLVFLVLYMIHHPLFWGTVAWIIGRVRLRHPIGTQVFLAVIFWTMPYAYVLFFGRGLPPWMYAAAAVILLAGAVHVGRDVKGRIAKAREAS
jgi:hypothetical protein